MTSNPEEQAHTPAAATVQTPKATQRTPGCATQAPCYARRAKVGKEGRWPERRPKSQKAAKQAKPGAREGSKAAKVLSLLRRPDGASLKQLMKVTGWLAHSVRGFMSGVVANWMGLKLVSARNEDGERRYTVQR